jgi:hypothetical protein
MSRTTRTEGFAGTGAAYQNGGSLPIYRCNDCGADVVWAKSARTGKPYLVNVSRGYHDQRYYRGDALHPRDCAAQKADRIDRENARLEWQAIAPAVADVTLDLSAAYRAGEIDDATFAEALDTLALLFPEEVSA